MDAAARSSPSSAGRTSASRRCSTGSSASATAIVEDRARTTRDRLYGEADWNGRRFLIVDTGGLEVDPRDPIEARVQEQARIAIAEADVIVFVVEAITGLTPRRPGGRRAPAPGEGAGARRREQEPTTTSASSRRPSSTRSAGSETYPIARDPRPRRRATCSTRSSGRCRRSPRRSSRARRREAEAEAWAREVADGPARADGRRRRAAGRARRRRTRTRTAPRPRLGCRRRRGRPQVGRADRQRVRRRAAGDRARRPAERRQVEPAQRPARRGADDRLRHPGHDPRRDRHDACRGAAARSCSSTPPASAGAGKVAGGPAAERYSTLRVAPGDRARRRRGPRSSTPSTG